MLAMMPVIPRSGSRKVNGYVKAVLALEAVRRKREERYERVVRPLDRKRDALTVEVATRLRALSGGQRAAAQRLLAMIAQGQRVMAPRIGGDATRLDRDHAARRGRPGAGRWRRAPSLRAALDSRRGTTARASWCSSRWSCWSVSRR